MRKFSAALARFVMDFAKALLTPARGRHSARRQRSTRVRRYARTLPPAPTRTTGVTRTTAAAGTTGVTIPERSSPPPPRREPSPTHLEEPALIRPYHHAHEQELRRIQEQANARLRAWTTQPPATHDQEPLFTPARPPSTPHTPAPQVPAPRIPAPRVPAKFDQLTHLSRIRQRQQHRLTGTGTSVKGAAV